MFQAAFLAKREVVEGSHLRSLVTWPEMDKYPVGIISFDYSSYKLYFLDQGTELREGK